jgi:hypothetical protein
MKVTSAKELCLRIKSEMTENHIENVDNDLKLKILDLFISHDPSDEVFERVLEARLSDPNPAKKQSKAICTQILNAWQNLNDDL